MNRLSSSQLKVAGMLSLLTAFLDIPLFLFGLIAGFTKNTQLLNMSAALSIVYAAMGVYIYITFKTLLNKRYKITTVNTYLMIFVVFMVLSSIATLCSVVFPSLLSILSVIQLLSTLPLGVVSILFAVKLLKTKQQLFGFLKPYAYATIVSGVLTVSIIFVILTPLVGIFADAFLGLILLKASSEKR